MLSLYEAQMSALAILRRGPQGGSPAGVLVNRGSVLLSRFQSPGPGHFASIRRLPNCPLFISNTRDSVSTSLAQRAVTLEALAVLIHKVVIQHSTSVLADSISGANGHKPIVDRPLKEDWNDDKLASGCTV